VTSEMEDAALSISFLHSTVVFYSMIPFGWSPGQSGLVPDLKVGGLVCGGGLYLMILRVLTNPSHCMMLLGSDVLIWRGEGTCSLTVGGSC